MKIVKNLIKKFLYKTSEFNPLRKFLNQYKNNSIIFCLHRVLPKKLRIKEDPKNLDFIISTNYLEKLIIKIKKNYKFVDLETLLKNYDSKKNFCHLTFDDGYLDNFKYAYPILKKHNVPCTIYISDSFAERNSQKKDFLCANSYNDFMEWKHIISLSNTKLVTIGCHTSNHYELSKLSKKKIYQEISSSKKKIEKKINKKIYNFAYPYGGINNFNDSSIKIINKLNFNNAVTAMCRKWYSTDSNFLIPRYFVTEECSHKILMTRINGLSNFFKNQLLP